MTKPMPLAEYLVGKIERQLEFYEHRARKIDGQYLAEVEKLARRIKDKVLAKFIVQSVTKEEITRDVSVIRDLIACGRIVEADRRLDALNARVTFADQHVSRPLLNLGIHIRAAQAVGLDQINSVRKTEARGRHRKWVEAARAIWGRNPGLSARECARRVQLKCTGPDRKDAKTIERVIGNYRPRR